MKNKKEEILALSEECLADIELSKIPLLKICLKAKRLARLSGDEMYEKAFDLEINGYPCQSYFILLESLPEELQKTAYLSNRVTVSENKKQVFPAGIPSIESEIESYKNRVKKEGRSGDINRLSGYEQSLSKRQTFIYTYILSKNTELKFNANFDYSKNNLIDRVSEIIVKQLLDGAKKINSAMDNLQSTNPEDWANAETTMRRILSDLAKKLEPNNQSDKYYTILKRYIKEEYKNVSEVHMRFIVDDVNDGTHDKTKKDETEKVLLHMCLFLDEIDWNKVDSSISS